MNLKRPTLEKEIYPQPAHNPGGAHPSVLRFTAAVAPPLQDQFINIREKLCVTAEFKQRASKASNLTSN